MEKFKTFFLIIRRNKRAFLGLIILLLFLAMAILGPYIIPLSMKANYIERLKPPSWSHPLGTDYAGRDTLAQFVHGSRDVILLSFLTSIITMLIAFIIGGISGTAGGKIDGILMFFTNVILTVPSFPIMMILSMVIKITNPLTFALVLSMWSWGGLARAIRSQILSLKRRDFIEASKILGLSLPHIVFKEIFPNMASYIAYHFIMIMKNAVTASVGLMVLGLVPFSPMHWGMMLNLAMTNTGALYGSSALVYFLTPVMGIMFFQMGCLFFSSGMDEAFNPRLRS
jgi:peptide/nickel transport system permease protein